MIINKNDYDDDYYFELLNDFIIELNLRAVSIKDLPEFEKLWKNDKTNIYLLKKNLIRLITSHIREYKNFNYNINDDNKGFKNAENRYGK